MVPKNGDIFLLQEKHIAIFYDNTGSKKGAEANAILSCYPHMSGTVGTYTLKYDTYKDLIIKDDPSVTYVGNLGNILKKVFI